MEWTVPSPGSSSVDNSSKAMYRELPGNHSCVMEDAPMADGIILSAELNVGFDPSLAGHSSGDELMHSKVLFGKCGMAMHSRLTQGACANSRAETPHNAYAEDTPSDMEMTRDVLVGSHHVQALQGPGGAGRPGQGSYRMGGDEMRPLAARLNAPTIPGPNAAGSRHWDRQTNAWAKPKCVSLPLVEELGNFFINDNSVRLDDEALKENYKRFEAAIVVKLFGKAIPFFHLNAELHLRWDKFGPFKMVMTSSRSFTCLFESIEARNNVMMGGPWLIAGQVLGMNVWKVGLSHAAKEAFSTPIWVRLPGLPLHCWDRLNLARITAPLGEPLWIDDATSQLDRGVFARVCVCMDLSKPVKAGVWIHSTLGSFFQQVEYEGLPILCFRCGLVGHKEPHCKASGMQRGGMLGSCALGMDLSCGHPAQEKPDAVQMANVPAAATMKPSGGSQTVSKPAEVSQSHAVSMDQPAAGDSSTECSLGPWTLVTNRRRFPPKLGRPFNRTQPPRAAKGKQVLSSSSPKDPVVISTDEDQSSGFKPRSAPSSDNTQPAAHSPPASPTHAQGVLVPLPPDSQVPPSSEEFRFSTTSTSSVERRTHQAKDGRFSKAFLDRLAGYLGPVISGPRKRGRLDPIFDGGDATPFAPE